LTPSINDIQLNRTLGYADCKDYLNVMLSVVMLNVVMLVVVMLNVIMLRVVMLIVVMLSAVAPQPQMLALDVDD
jgi:hypothetical protein